MESIGCIQDCSLVRKAQGGNQAAFEQLVHTYDQAVLQEAGRLPVRVLLLYLDLPHCHQRLPGSPAEESSPQKE